MVVYGNWNFKKILTLCIFSAIMHILRLAETESLAGVHPESGSDSRLVWTETGTCVEHIVPVFFYRLHSF